MTEETAFSVYIRPVKPEDCEQLHMLLATYDHPKLTDMAIRLIANRVHLSKLNKIGLSLVAETVPASNVANTQNSELVGFCNGYICPDGSLMISDVVVAPNFRNHGIAKKLLLRQREIALSKGIKYMWGTVSDDNAAAIRVYNSLGFELKRVTPPMLMFPGAYKFFYKIL